MELQYWQKIFCVKHLIASSIGSDPWRRPLTLITEVMSSQADCCKSLLVTEDTVTSLCYLTVMVKGMGSKIVSLLQYKYSLYVVGGWVIQGK